MQLKTTTLFMCWFPRDKTCSNICRIFLVFKMPSAVLQWKVWQIIFLYTRFIALLAVPEGNSYCHAFVSRHHLLTSSILPAGHPLEYLTDFFNVTAALRTSPDTGPSWYTLAVHQACLMYPCLIWLDCISPNYGTWLDQTLLKCRRTKEVGMLNERTIKNHEVERFNWQKSNKE